MEPVEILELTPELVLCVKPAGVLSQSGKPGEETMISRLERQLGGEIFPVHRLDRETAGVMVYARTSRAAGELGKLVQQGELKKEYLVVVRGWPQEDAGVLEDLLYHDQAKNKSYVVKRERRSVKKARLAYRVLAKNETTSLIQVRLYTGRTHQIRVQFASRGLPLQGDSRYGGGNGTLALWAARLRFVWKGREICCSCVPETLGPFQPLPPLEPLE